MMSASFPGSIVPSWLPFPKMRALRTWQRSKNNKNDIAMSSPQLSTLVSALAPARLEISSDGTTVLQVRKKRPLWHCRKTRNQFIYSTGVRPSRPGFLESASCRLGCLFSAISLLSRECGEGPLRRPDRMGVQYKAFEYFVLGDFAWSLCHIRNYDNVRRSNSLSKFSKIVF